MFGCFLLGRLPHALLESPEQLRTVAQMAVAQKTGTKMEPWQVETWTKTCATPESPKNQVFQRTIVKSAERQTRFSSTRCLGAYPMVVATPPREQKMDEKSTKNNNKQTNKHKTRTGEPWPFLCGIWKEAGAERAMTLPSVDSGTFGCGSKLTRDAETFEIFKFLDGHGSKKAALFKMVN